MQKEETGVKKAPKIWTLFRPPKTGGQCAQGLTELGLGEVWIVRMGNGHGRVTERRQNEMRERLGRLLPHNSGIHEIPQQPHEIAENDLGMEFAPFRPAEH